MLAGDALETLLDSYESERRPVGAEVVARTRAASVDYGREPRGKLERLADTQILVSYRNTPWVRDDAKGLAATVPEAGDRAPDVGGLRRYGIGFPIRLFDVLRGTEHVVLAHLASSKSQSEISQLGTFAREMNARFGLRVRIAAIASHSHLAVCPGVALYHDAETRMRTAYGTEDAVFLIRPDGYIGWRGRSWRDIGLESQLNRILKEAEGG